LPSSGSAGLIGCETVRAVFVFTSINKVYGNAPNGPPLIDQETRRDVDADQRAALGAS
jgi:hypothetical protein